MKAYIISDEDYKTEEYKVLRQKLGEFLAERKFEIQETSIAKDELHFCVGCYGCWMKKPGECVMNDAMTNINKTFNQSDIVIYLSPIVFGQYSANIKKAIDRGLPNVLPLFVPKADGTTGHPSRYKTKPKIIVIGYGEEVSKDESHLFQQIVKHRLDITALVFSKDTSDFTKELGTIELKRIEV